FWVIAIDLDHFKQVNDTFGHDAGDTVLKAFAEVLKSNTRSSDISGRIGGEEFLHVLTHVDSTNIPMIVERARMKLAAQSFAFSGSVVRVTASFGVAGFGGRGEAPTFSELV